ncbi:MAG TPA: hypothetical protein VGI43_10410 [Mucilaginibacter sp.]|jgi:hypothetical protein
MKKTFFVNIIFCFSAALLILVFSTCKKSAVEINADIYGKWSNNFLGAPGVVTQYRFKSIDSVEYFVSKIDTVTQNTIGYSSRTIGKFKIENATLTMYNLQTFTNPANTFGTLAQLVPGSGPAVLTYSISINDQKKQLLVYFTCPANANCVSSPLVYYKE